MVINYNYAELSPDNTFLNIPCIWSFSENPQSYLI